MGRVPPERIQAALRPLFEAAERIWERTRAAALAAYERLRPFLVPSDTNFLAALAVLIGLVTAIGAYATDWLIEAIFRIGMGATAVGLAHMPFGARWQTLLLPALGGLIVGPIIYYLSPESKGHGVPEVMIAVARNGGRIRGRVAALKAVCSALTIGTGGSAGREGPIVQIGSALGSRLAQFARMPPAVTSTMVAGGAAAGIAAAFNAPLGGMAFAMEIILRRFTPGPFAMVVLSTVVAATASRALHGSNAYFQVPAYRLKHPAELGLYVLLGICAGFVAKWFTRILYRFEDTFDGWSAVHARWRPAVGGLLTGVLGLYLPGVLGTGHSVIEQALLGGFPVWVMALMIPGKMLATAFTLGSGGSGGIFMPSLFMGAMLGGTLGHYFNFITPWDVSPGAYAMVGMAAVFGAATHAPLTAILILFEMTYDYAIILPVMLATVSAILVGRMLEPETIYTLKLLRKGVRLSGNETSTLLERTLIEDIMARRVESLRADEPLGAVVRRFQTSKHSGFPVLDQDGKLKGLVTYAEIQEATSGETPADASSPIERFALVRLPLLYPDDTAAQAVRLMHGGGFDRLPVVARTDKSRMVGLLSQGDLVKLYGRILSKERSSLETDFS
ncbi:MAG TPA: hypothetical protein DCM05_16700 [Elusimicrobia bacterium]|nr:hypothetical protein [Elusimicrobiota bacterium]